MNEDIELIIEGLLKETLKRLDEDRRQAQDLFNELYVMFLQGKNAPEDINQLNKTQELIQATTDKMVNIIGKLVQLRNGAMRLQIAQVNANNKSLIDEGEGILTPEARKALIDLLEEQGVKPIDAKILEEGVKEDGNG